MAGVDVGNTTMQESDDSDSDGEEDYAAVVASCKAALRSNPYHYESHVLLIATLRKAGEMDQLRHARTKMSLVYPLTEKLWLEWTTDERSVCTDASHKEKVIRVFENGVKDYICPDLWVQYAKFVGYDLDDDMIVSSDHANQARAIFERAVTLDGNHFTNGKAVWKAYYSFEWDILESLQKANADGVKEAKERVSEVLRRWHASPIATDGEIDILVDNWHSKEEKDIDIKWVKAKERADKMRTKYSELEQSLAETVGTPAQLEAYRKYINFEENSKSVSPHRVRLIYERAVNDNALASDIWSGYVSFMAKRGGEPAIDVHARAVRNCPWVFELWQSYIWVLERENRKVDDIKNVFDKMKLAATGQVSGYPWPLNTCVDMWSCLAEYHFRRVLKCPKASDAYGDLIATWRSTLKEAKSDITMKFGANADPNAHLDQYQARLEASVLTNIDSTREIYNKLMKSYGKRASMWLTYASLERAYGTIEDCRKILRLAVQCGSDDPTAACQALLSFERDLGSLDDFAEAKRRTNVKLTQAIEKAKKNTEQSNAKSGMQDKKNMKQRVKRRRDDNTDNEDGQGNASNSSGNKRAKISVPKNSAKAPKVKDIGPALPKETGPIKEIGPIKPTDTKSSQPKPIGPTIPVELAEVEETTNVEEPMEGSNESTMESQSKRNVEVDVQSYDNSVFVSNLDFKVTEDELHQVFGSCGTIKEVRLVRNRAGLSKGFAYVEYESKESVPTALKLDRLRDARLENRPVFVSVCEDKSQNPTEFKYSVGLETKKLFVNGLEFSLTQVEVKNYFKQFGALKDVRIAQKRNGQSKGIAYVEFENESDAKRAVLEGNGYSLKGRPIKVEFSNPPARSNRQGGEKTFASKAQNIRPANQAFQPRAVERKQRLTIDRSKGNDEIDPTKAASAASQGPKPVPTKKSNDYFASLFKKK